MTEKNSLAPRRVRSAAVYALALLLIPTASRAADEIAPSTDRGASSTIAAEIPAKPAGDSPIIFTPLPLRPGLTDDAIVHVPDNVSNGDVSAVALPDDRRCLAEAIYYEARGESLQGQEAIAEVVFHRMQSGRYPKTICGVVYQGAASRHGCQFSFTCDGEMIAPKLASAWRRADHLATEILGGLVQLGDMTEDAISFHAADVRPGWGDHLVRTIRIGKHVFYRSALHLTRPS